ncbi:aggregation-promoting factor C-terminal-like domain-containing protein [Leifsonia xyli]|uniref:aggregation-promoting factor C-terminal-like domain-containing protein n=1 Tax=Leifsonia xyli TaxID=1575 RepID=UPI0005C57709|nr:hypothetical protein [Leifsonia xyli]
MGRRYGVSKTVVAALVGALILTAGVAPAAADDYPSWDDVQAAKANASSAQAEADKISGLLAQLQSTANAAGDLAIKRAGEYGTAETNLQAATAKSDDLAQQSAAAAAKADRLKAQSGKLAAQLTRSGTSDVSLRVFLSANDRSPADSSLLYQLGAMSRLADQASSLFAQATAQKNVADALSAQAAAAQRIRDRLAQDAETALQAAQAAKAAADAALSEQQTRANTLYAQLASLKNTEASVERSYAEGVAARAAAAAAANSGGGADGFAPPPGVVVDPAGAQAYAQSRLPAYGWGGTQMACLIKLWNQESGWRADAYNTSSGAYGIPQSLPASKMATAGSDWMTNGNTQIDWGLGYISGRYGSPCGAWSHEIAYNWY